MKHPALRAGSPSPIDLRPPARSRAARRLSFVVLALVGGLGCSPDKVMETATSGPADDKAEAPKDAGAPAPAVAPVPRADFAENDFVESDRNRDPFRSYAAALGSDSKKITRAQREVVLAQFSLDELKLVAIVTGGEYPRAMFVDPGGKGWVVKRGDWVGRPDVVHVGGANGVDYQINWRVAKVREGDVVFTREDPAQPGIPPASRVIALRTDSEQAHDTL